MSAAWDLEDGEALVPAESLVRRRAGVRARSTDMRRLSKRRLAVWGAEADAMLAELDAAAIERPRTRHECLQGDNAERPCPFVSCEYHLYLDVDEEHGSIKENFPDLEVWEMPETCALDVADRGGVVLEELGALMNLTRERIRQVETKALARVRPVAVAALRDYAGLERECVVVGNHHTVEIWDEQAWQEYLRAQDDQFADLSEEVVPGLF